MNMMMEIQLLIESESENEKGKGKRVSIYQLREIVEIDVFGRGVSGSDDDDANLYNFFSSYL